MTEITYYARLGPGDVPGRPAGLVRRRHTAVYPTDEVLRRDGEWHPTDLMERAAMGDLADELVPIPQPLADQITARWRQVAGEQDAQLAAQGRGELGELRLAVFPPDESADRLAAAERDLVARYLREAPVAVSVFGLGPDPFDPAAEEVPLNVRTDGRWVWSESLAYLATRYGVAPQSELLAHIRDRRYRWPTVSPAVIARAALLAGGGPA